MNSPPRKRYRFAVWYESTPRPQIFLIGLIAALYAPSLFGDFMVDDHRLLRVFREYRDGDRPAPNAYQFLSGGEPNRAERAAGRYPWWMPDDLKYKHFRPLSEWFLYGEYLLFDDNPVCYRLIGITLYALGVLLVLRLFRAAGGDERLARWGALIFAVAGCHAIPVIFISAHCDILALLLAVAAALAVVRFLLKGSRSALFVASAFFTAGLFAKEAMLPMVWFPLCAWMVFRNRPRSSHRARAVGGCWLVLALAWLALYVSSKCGANTALMLDPIAAPLDYLRSAPQRAVLLLSTWLIPLNPFLLEFQLGRGDLLKYYAAAGFVVISIVAVMFLLHHRHQRGVAGMALWAVLFLPILVCTPTDDRVMVLPSIGLSFLAAAWLTRPRADGSFRLRALPLCLFVVIQFITAGLTITVMNYMERCAQNNLRTIARAVTGPPRPDERIFVLNCPYSYDGLFMQDRMRRVMRTSTVGPRLLSDLADPVVTRVGARTLRIEAKGARFFQSFLGRMGTTRGRPKRVGEVFDAGAFKARIVDADDRGVKAVELDFEKPLESDSYRFYWFQSNGSPRPWPIPQTSNITPAK